MTPLPEISQSNKPTAPGFFSWTEISRRSNQIAYCRSVTRCADEFGYRLYEQAEILRVNDDRVVEPPSALVNRIEDGNSDNEFDDALQREPGVVKNTCGSGGALNTRADAAVEAFGNGGKGRLETRNVEIYRAGEGRENSV